jgi:hypothetical protein
VGGHSLHSPFDEELRDALVSEHQLHGHPLLYYIAACTLQN